MGKTRSYQETLKETLKDPEDAAAYLNAALEENDPAAFLLALKDVAEVQGGMVRVAKAAELNRENLYRILSENGNPRITSLNAILNAFGLRLSVTIEKSRRSVA